MNEITESQQSPEPELSPAALSRRRALQAALGTGVAVAAWSLPQVRAAAQVPFPGGVCTLPVLEDDIPVKKNVTCEASCPGYITYNDGGNENIQIDFDGTPQGCSAPPGAHYTITTSGALEGYVCVITSVTFKNTGAITSDTAGLAPSIKQGGAVRATSSYKASAWPAARNRASTLS